jgi:hypothetical protein
MHIDLNGLESLALIMTGELDCALLLDEARHVQWAERLPYQLRLGWLIATSSHTRCFSAVTALVLRALHDDGTRSGQLRTQHSTPCRSPPASWNQKSLWVLSHVSTRCCRKGLPECLEIHISLSILLDDSLSSAQNVTRAWAGRHAIYGC